MTEKETPDAVSPENAANLLKLEEELKRSRDHWGVTYQILKRIRGRILAERRVSELHALARGSGEKKRHARERALEAVRGRASL